MKIVTDLYICQSTNSFKSGSFQSDISSFKEIKKKQMLQENPRKCLVLLSNTLIILFNHGMNNEWLVSGLIK